MKTLLQLTALCTAALALPLVQPAHAQYVPMRQVEPVPVATQDTSKDIMATLEASGNYKTLAKLLQTSNLASTLQGSARFTVFAPTDEAFAKVPKDELDKLMSDSVALRKVLLYHVVSGRIPANEILKLKTARTMQGSRVEFMMKDTRLKVNDAVILQPDMRASNGVIHGIDAVLMPKKM